MDNQQFMSTSPPVPPIDIRCPTCSSSKAVLNHVSRSFRFYFCKDCEHQWKVEDTGQQPTHGRTATG